MGNRSGKARKKKEEKTKTPEGDLLERRGFLWVVEGCSHWPESLESTLVAGSWPPSGVSQRYSPNSPSWEWSRVGVKWAPEFPHFSIYDWVAKFSTELWKAWEASFSLESNMWSKVQLFVRRQEFWSLSLSYIYFLMAPNTKRMVEYITLWNPNQM